MDGSTNVLRVLVGNKCDKESEVPSHVGEQFAQNHNFDLFMETSALQLANVDQLFQDIGERLVERRLETLKLQSSTLAQRHHMTSNNNNNSLTDSK